MDLDLRKLRYFVAVAEELHFGRAAARLHIAQPALSRQVRALEDQLRVALFDRDRRGATLTPAGEQLLHDAPELLAAADGMRRRVCRAAGRIETFTVAFAPGIAVTAPVQVFLTRFPEVSVEVMPVPVDNQALVVLDGRADVSFVRMPVPRRGLGLRPMFTEPRVAVVPRSHRLAGEPAIGIAELADEWLLQDPDLVPEWRDLTSRRQPAADPHAAPEARSVEGMLEYVAAQRGVMVLPRSAATYYSRDDVRHVPVTDIAPCQVSLVWSAGRDTALVRDFGDIAEACYT
jgi:DNA-binding transcriptional LysR family regulator